jgi:glycerol uptake facilitator-like aquaporin
MTYYRLKLGVTCHLQVIGNGSIAQSQLTNGEKGDYFTINWGWALGCSLGILISANISGKNK